MVAVVIVAIVVAVAVVVVAVVVVLLGLKSQDAGYKVLLEALRRQPASLAFPYQLDLFQGHQLRLRGH